MNLKLPLIFLGYDLLLKRKLPKFWTLMLVCHILLDKMNTADMARGQVHTESTWVVTVFKNPSQYGKQKGWSSY